MLEDVQRRGQISPRKFVSQCRLSKVNSKSVDVGLGRSAASAALIMP